MNRLPKRRRGRQSAAEAERYQAELAEFCAEIREIESRLDFKVSSRGWAYILENAGTITKGDFDAAQRLINDCRKSGTLPLDICSEDDGSAADNLQRIDETSPDEEAADILERIDDAHRWYNPFDFWDDQPFYVEMLVEKSDLKSLFKTVCADLYVPIANAGGWSDINARAAVMRRFAERESENQQCVLLWCGDHDPGGLHISDFVRSNFEDLAGAVGWHPDNLIIDRFGLNFDFIDANKLTWIDNLETGNGKRLDDPRHPDHRRPYVQSYLKKFGARKVEANALVTHPQAGRDLCRRAILKYLPATAPQAYLEKLSAAQQEVRDKVAQLMGRASP